MSTRWWGCRSCRSEGSPTTNRASCWRRSSRADSTSPFATGSSPSCCRCNPLALLELPWGMSVAELAGGFALPDSGDIPGLIEDHYRRRIGGLPDVTRRLMLVAAADPVGDAALVWRVARAVGVGREAAAPAAAEQLLEIGARVRFRHPLVRSAVYRSSPAADRQATHSALAAATDGDTDPDRRGRHRGQATSGPDEEVAAELERSAGRLRRGRAGRGRRGAPGAFGEPDRRSGVPGGADAGGCSVQRASRRVRGHACAVGRSGRRGARGAPRPPEWTCCVSAGIRITSRQRSDTALASRRPKARRLDVELARETYLDAFSAALSGPASMNASASPTWHRLPEPRRAGHTPSRCLATSVGRVERAHRDYDRPFRYAGTHCRNPRRAGLA